MCSRAPKLIKTQVRMMGRSRGRRGERVGTWGGEIQYYYCDRTNALVSQVKEDLQGIEPFDHRDKACAVQAVEG